MSATIFIDLYSLFYAIVYLILDWSSEQSVPCAWRNSNFPIISSRCLLLRAPLNIMWISIQYCPVLAPENQWNQPANLLMAQLISHYRVVIFRRQLCPYFDACPQPGGKGGATAALLALRCGSYQESWNAGSASVEEYFALNQPTWRVSLCHLPNLLIVLFLWFPRHEAICNTRGGGRGPVQRDRRCSVLVPEPGHLWEQPPDLTMRVYKYRYHLPSQPVFVPF